MLGARSLLLGLYLCSRLSCEIIVHVLDLWSDIVNVLDLYPAIGLHTILIIFIHLYLIYACWGGDYIYCTCTFDILS